jgi:hypothetical protein
MSKQKLSSDGGFAEVEGKDTLPPTPEEVNFTKDAGSPQLECSACQYFEAGRCNLLKIAVGVDDYCDAFAANLQTGRKSSREAQAEVAVSAIEIPMFITRVSTDRQSGARRWHATASGLAKDLYAERMSIQLYKDFIKRINTREPAPEPFTSKAWNGGLPYLGIAHYLDLEGYGIIGPTDQVFIDGKTLKMRGSFDDTPMADKAYEAIEKDIKDKVPQNERVRVSIAFIDWAHKHDGVGEFVRKSLKSQCKLCAKGVGDKVYLSGHLVHLALTRRPAYEDTSITLEERSMEEKSAKKEDAASIVGDEFAEELEKRDDALAKRSSEEVAPGAVVIRQDEEEDEDEDKKKRKGEESSEDDGAAYRALGGAKNLDEADAFLEKSGDGLIDSWGVFADVLSNLVSEESAPAIREVVKDFQSRLDVMTAKAVIDISKSLSGGVKVAEEVVTTEPEITEEVIETPTEPEAEVVEETPHILDEALMKIRVAFDDAVATPGDKNQKLAMLQPAVVELAEALQKSVDPQAESVPSAGLSVDDLNQALAPLYAQIEALTEKADAPVERRPATPIRRAISPVSPVSPSQPEQKAGGLKSVIRRSVGLGG